MDFGFNPVLTAVPGRGRRAGAPRRSSSEFKTYGVNGTTKVLGVQKVTVPAGNVRGARRAQHAYAARLPVRKRHAHVLVRAGQGLVKLVFDHGDKSVSTVVLLH